jgi:hypothetical protein
LSHSAFAFNVARAVSDRAALSKLKLISFNGPAAAASPLRKASRLEVVLGSDLGAALAAAVAAPVEALGFSAVHFGGGGAAGVPQEKKNIIANKLKP